MFTLRLPTGWFSPKILLLPLLLALAACQSLQSKPEPVPVVAPGSASIVRALQQEGASIAVYAAANSPTADYRPVKIAADRTIYVARRALLVQKHFTQARVTHTGVQGHNVLFVRLSLTPEGMAAIGQQKTFLVISQGQIISNAAFRHGQHFFFRANNLEEANLAVRLINRHLNQ